MALVLRTPFADIIVLKRRAKSEITCVVSVIEEEVAKLTEVVVTKVVVIRAIAIESSIYGCVVIAPNAVRGDNEAKNSNTIIIIE